MLAKLGTKGMPAIAVVDNCNVETHRELTKLVEAHADALSLLTIVPHPISVTRALRQALRNTVTSIEAMK